MTEQEILNGAPEGAVCVDSTGGYFNVRGVILVDNCERPDFHDFPEMPCRSLDDIQTIVDLRKQVAELEKERDALIVFSSHLINCHKEGVKCLVDHDYSEYVAQRDIEMKIAGIQRVIDCRECDFTQGEIDTMRLMQQQLRAEVK